ncbi:hypothetical protein [Blastopirellula marina]|uniref:Uncharacterized protein n=1 Tax=Blastopirellula marina TaxID=124 RepID=A0A2S8GID8_9BACT|nr:hypothetical protein [Blastopirellula marina]PQO44212.1 hypothetical protein C5Y93_19765 [Blastopirellula marina]
MSSGSATLKISTDTKDGQAAVKQLVEQMQKLREENRKLAEESNKAADAGSKGFSKLADSLKSTLTQIVSVGGGFEAVRRSLEDIQRIQDAMALKSKTIGQAQAEWMGNAGGLTAQQKAAGLDAATKASIAAGVSPTMGISAHSKAMSSTSADVAASTRALKTAAPISGGNQATLDEMTAGVALISGATGMKEEESAGLMMSFQANSLVRNTGKVAAAVPSAIQSGIATSKGISNREAARQSVGGLAWMTHAGDVNGDTSRTGFVNLNTSLETFYRDRGITDPGSFQGRVSGLQGDQRLAEAYLKKYPGEALFQAQTRGLLTNDPATVADFNKTMGSIKADVSAYKSQAQAMQYGTPELAANTIANQAQALGQSRAMADPAGAMMAEMRNLTDMQFESSAAAGKGDWLRWRNIRGYGSRTSGFAFGRNEQADRELMMSFDEFRATAGDLPKGGYSPDIGNVQDYMQRQIDEETDPTLKAILETQRDTYNVQLRIAEALEKNISKPTIQPNIHVEGR